jgi:hypothetical protein
MRPAFARFGASFDANRAQQTFIADYNDALPLIDYSDPLIDYLYELLVSRPHLTSTHKNVKFVKLCKVSELSPLQR